VVRKQHPLAMHANARTAAFAACCADEAGAGDAMAEALFKAPPGELTADGCARLAASVGVEPDRFASCMASERPAARVAADAADARAAGIGQEAPVFFVGATRFRGAQRPEVIRAAIERELALR
jgi:predicted DsbA family dithiol-disulfide isomerase